MEEPQILEAPTLIRQLDDFSVRKSMEGKFQLAVRAAEYRSPDDAQKRMEIAGYALAARAGMLTEKGMDQGLGFTEALSSAFGTLQSEEELPLFARARQNTFGEEARKRRQNKKLSQGELAELLGCSQTAVSQFENGNLTSFSPEKTEALCRELELPVPSEGDKLALYAGEMPSFVRAAEKNPLVEISLKDNPANIIPIRKAASAILGTHWKYHEAFNMLYDPQPFADALASKIAGL